MGHDRRADLMPDVERAKSEREFNQWLDSIDFVDNTGRVVPPELTEDESSDPEGDRG
jgi:hypothetical protein